MNEEPEQSERPDPLEATAQSVPFDLDEGPDQVIEQQNIGPELGRVAASGHRRIRRLGVRHREQLSR
jgi:hypothetical protein